MGESVNTSTKIKYIQRKIPIEKELLSVAEVYFQLSLIFTFLL